ncbi:MAG: rhomboid family intramembrane serine protease [Limisphaerales bacterium]
MLEDRDYMRQPDYHPVRVSFTVAVLILCAVVFIIECIATGYPPVFSEGNYFVLSLAGLKHGYVWQLLTYQFMHAGFLHILLNGLVIYFFGRFVEEMFGGKKFLILFLTGGVIGGLVQMLAAWLWPAHFGDAVIGASAGAYGLVAAFAVVNWSQRFTLLIYFIPVAMCGRTLFWGSIGVTIIMGLIPNTGIANAAHLGGILTGFLFAQIIQGRWHLPQWKFPSRRSKPREFVAASTGKNKFWSSAANQPDEDLSADEFLKNEVDPILDKISAHGIQSLTSRERDILEKARSKMSKR